MRNIRIYKKFIYVYTRTHARTHTRTRNSATYIIQADNFTTYPCRTPLGRSC